MRLIIKEHAGSMHIDDTYNFDISMLNYQSAHMFIASNEWDEIIVDVTDDINPESVKYLTSACPKVFCYLPENVTEKTLSILCAIYPTLAGKLRMGYMAKQDLTHIIPEREYV